MSGQSRMKAGLVHCHNRLGQAVQRSAYCGLALSTQSVTTTITGWCECTMAPHSSRIACRITVLHSRMAVLVFLHAAGGSDLQLPTWHYAYQQLQWGPKRCTVKHRPSPVNDGTQLGARCDMAHTSWDHRCI